MYKIEISYQTGDSFKTEDAEQFIEYIWNDIKVVEQNLLRIKEHYEWYQDAQKRFNTKNLVKPKFVHDKHDWSLLLVMDDGQEVYYSCFWIGYFETLYAAKVVMDLPAVRF